MRLGSQGSALFLSRFHNPIPYPIPSWMSVGMLALPLCGAYGGRALLLPLATPDSLHTPQGTSSAFKPPPTIDRGRGRRGRGTHRRAAEAAHSAAAPPPSTAARPRMKWSLRTAPTWRRATDRLPQEREGERAAASTAFLPHRRCMDVQLIRPLSSSGSSHSSDPLTLLFVLHLAPEQRGELARHRPRRSRTHFRRGEREQDEERRRRRRRRRADVAAAVGYISAGGIHGRADARAREGKRSGLSRLAHRGKERLRQRGLRLKTDGPSVGRRSTDEGR